MTISLDSSTTIAIAAAIGLVLLPLAIYLLHKTCIWLEDHDYIYYRKSPDFKGGIGNVLLDIDRLTRPQSIHIAQAQEPEREERREKAGDPP